MGIIATNDAGRLHIGYGEKGSFAKCLGKSINSYYFFISKFFTKLFGYSMDIEIGGKIRCVNIKSFKNHLESIGLNLDNIEEIRKLGYSAFIKNNHNSISCSEGNFSDVLSNEKRERLFVKMVAKLQENDTEAVEKLIRKGAYLDKEFYLFFSESHGRKFIYNKTDLEITLREQGTKTDFYSYTPLALVAAEPNQELSRLFSKFKMDISSDKKRTSRFTPGSGNDWNIETIITQKVVQNGDGTYLLRNSKVTS